ncbi:TIR domain-containing protein [uncultured Akkermansia sp.]|jgi:predicted nucleotide-binding protein|uniref:TIR domain-containing protein n=1 Tax=uncultured Akkermansia sp. TaxID=512294 RepID=UPI0025D537F7|nr:TIR domain-containing protein [uncultured Akkermansia sp.]
MEYDFNLIRKILLQTVGENIDLGKISKDIQGECAYHLIKKGFLEGSYVEGVGDNGKYSYIGIIKEITDKGYMLLDLIKDESILLKIKNYAQENSITLTFSNIENIANHIKSLSYSTISKATSNQRGISNRIFIVHGRDIGFRYEVKDFVKSIGLEPIILTEQASMSLTIIEKIENYSDVGFVIVLYTGCDEGRLKQSGNLRLRARQNVVFEHGFFIGKIGRNRVVAIKEDGVETPNDIIERNKNWRNELIKELYGAGYTLPIINKI